jgi:hypothetical protein
VLSIVVMGGTIERIDNISEISRHVEYLGCSLAKRIEGELLLERVLVGVSSNLTECICGVNYTVYSVILAG